MVLALGLAGCTTTAQNGPPAAMTSATPPASGDTRTLAFESIDGPPEAVFHSLVAALNREVENRQAPVVSRHDQATYRVRGYLSAHVSRGKTSIAFAWDVYDGAARHIMRLAGEVPAGVRSADAWKAADDAVLTRIADEGLTRLAALIGPYQAPPSPSAPPAPPVQATSAIASAAPGPAGDTPATGSVQLAASLPASPAE
ncbi:MAG TPA: hypothetical protein VNQ99_00595 [Xanthobacteraceae bacterium]|nr:hypothetical protein [Xanthobacteraceae bacterium]